MKRKRGQFQAVIVGPVVVTWTRQPGAGPIVDRAWTRTDDGRRFRSLALLLTQWWRRKRNRGIAPALVIGWRTAALVVAIVMHLAGNASAADTPAVPAPASGPAPAVVSISVGGEVTMGEADAALTPTVILSVEWPLSTADLAPLAIVTGKFGGLQGEAVELADPTTFHTLQFDLQAAQRVSRRISGAIYLGVGFATMLGTDPEPVHKAPRYWSAGVRFGGAGTAGWLSVGVGMDQRLTGAYQPAAVVAGALRLYTVDKGALAGGSVQLHGEAILGLNLSTRWPGYDGGGRDVVRVGVSIGR